MEIKVISKANRWSLGKDRNGREREGLKGLKK
jgi:hypothetical protein